MFFQENPIIINPTKNSCNSLCTYLPTYLPTYRYDASVLCQLYGLSMRS